MALKFVQVEPQKPSFFSRFNRIWMVQGTWGWIRLYPNPGVRIGKFYWSRARGFNPSKLLR